MKEQEEMKNNVLTYKGYYGSVEFSLEDNYLFGSLIGLENGVMTYEGSTLNELKNRFEETVNMYLEHCRECEIEPRTFQHRFLRRLFYLSGNVGRIRLRHFAILRRRQLAATASQYTNAVGVGTENRYPHPNPGWPRISTRAWHHPPRPETAKHTDSTQAERRISTQNHRLRYQQKV